MESDRPGLFCRDVMSCAVFYNYMRGKSEGDPQSRDVPFQDPGTVDISSLTIGFADNSETTGWPEAWDTPLKGKRGNVKDKLVASGATVIEKPHLKDFFVLPQLLLDYEAAGIGNEWFGWWDWYTAHAQHHTSSSPGASSNPAPPPPSGTGSTSRASSRTSSSTARRRGRRTARYGMGRTPTSTRATTSTTSSRRRTLATRLGPHSARPSSPLSSSPRYPPPTTTGTRTSTTSGSTAS